MNHYTAYWPADWVRSLARNGDVGPLQVVYGGEHRSQPPLGRVKVGDWIYPVCLQSGKLYLLARMQVARIEQADATTQALGLQREGTHLWDSWLLQHPEQATHLVPRTCADHAAVGQHGTAIRPREVPPAVVEALRVGPKPGAEEPLKYKNGSLAPTNFAGYFRRLSEASAALLEQILTQA